jgi:RND family efflux transporter MFP subunit
VVVRLDDAALRSARSAAEAAAEAAETDRTRVEALAAKSAATPRERDDSLARAAAARAAVVRARDDLAYAVLRAPFDGVVARRSVSVGDVVAPGAPLIELEGNDGLELRASVRAERAAALRPGQALSCEVDGQAAPLSAVIRSISSAADPATHRVEIRADLPPAAGLRSGLFARVAIPRGDAAPRLVVPAAALVERGGLAGLFVVSEGRAALRWVAVGRREGSTVELRAGVQAGERTVLDPAGLTDGASVEVVP